MVTALVAVLATTMLVRHRLVLTRAQHVTAGAQAYEYALGAEAYARQLLHEDHVKNPQPPRTDSLADAWAQPLVFPIEGGTLQLVVVDATSRPNINALAAAGQNPAVDRVRNLLHGLGLDESAVEPLRDWVDADDVNAGFGAEDAEYLLRKPAYRAANAPMADASEVQLIDVLDADTRAALRREMTALPSTFGHVNVNTATPQALLSLSRDLSPADAEAIAAGDRAYQDPAAIIAEFPVLGPAVAAISVASDYFAVHCRVDYGGVSVHLSSLVWRNPEDGSTRVVARSLGERHFQGAGGARDAAEDGSAGGTQ